MRESRTYGFVRGARGNSRPYRVKAAGVSCGSMVLKKSLMSLASPSI